jgi:hypothetical protein
MLPLLIRTASIAAGSTAFSYMEMLSAMMKQLVAAG